MEQKHFQTLRALNKSGYTADVVHKLNKDSRQSAQRWSDKSIMTDLTTPNRLPIGWREDGLSTLTRLRIYELRDAMERAGLNSNYWFVSNQLTKDTWEIDNPFLMRHFEVSFCQRNEMIECYWYDTGVKQIKTSNIIEAILLSQP